LNIKKTPKGKPCYENQMTNAGAKTEPAETAANHGLVRWLFASGFNKSRRVAETIPRNPRKVCYFNGNKT
jgi:hypothetical protein